MPGASGAVTDMAWYLGYDPDCAGNRWLDDLRIERVYETTVTTGIKDYAVEETTGNPGSTGYGWGSAIDYDDSGLSSGTQYCYRVRARDEAGNVSGWSEAACETTE